MMGDDFNAFYQAYREAVHQLDLAITVRVKNRKTPDIVWIWGSGDVYRKHARMGSFADLTKYFERDIDKSLIYENAFEALKVNEKLYGIFREFALLGIHMDESMMGIDMSLEAMLKLQKEADYSILGKSDKMGNFDDWFRMYRDEFVDWENWKCNFDTPGFISILEMSNNIPGNEEDDYWDIIAMIIQEKRPLFCYFYSDMYFYQFWNSMYARNFGKMIFSGVPGLENTVEIITPHIFVITKSSPHKEVAWDFISTYISEDYQMKHVDIIANGEKWGSRIFRIPVLRNALDMMIEEKVAMKRKPLYWPDFMPGFVPVLEDRVMEDYKCILEWDMWINYEDEIIQKIVLEEVTPFFDGFVSIERVIGNLNNRVQLYLDEIRR